MLQSGLIPGFHSEAHRAALYAGQRRFIAAGGAVRCVSKAKHGGQCNGAALQGQKHCRYHASGTVKCSRRLTRLGRLRTQDQALVAMRREAARVQRIVWRVDRWAPGATVTLGQRDAVFLTDVRRSGFDPEAFSPATIDAARWAWLHLQVGRMDQAQFRGRLAWHSGRD